MRDALSLLDQVIAYCGEDFSNERVAECLGIINNELFFPLLMLLGRKFMKNDSYSR